MPGFMDAMRQRFGGGRLPIQSPGMEGGPQPQMNPGMPPPMNGRGFDIGMPLDSGFVKPGGLGGFEEYQEQTPSPMPMQKPMMNPDQMAVRRPRRQGRSSPRMGQGGEPVF